MTTGDQGKLSRRGFIAGSMAATAVPFLLVPRDVLGATDKPAPNDRLNIAGIGIGGMGGHNIGNLAKENNIVALCDVDWERAEPVFNSFPEAKKYKNFREMLATEKDLDGVVVATPDHTHAPAAIPTITMAARMFRMSAYPVAS